MAFTKIRRWLLQQSNADKAQQYHRQLLVIHGLPDWVYRRATELVNAIPPTMTSCWVGETAPECVTYHQTPTHVRKCLGTEHDIVIFDGMEGFRPGAFLSICGTLKGGGRLILLAPTLSTWHQHSTVRAAYFLSFGETLLESRYIHRLSQRLLTDPNVARWSAAEAVLPVLKEHPRPFLTKGAFASEDQKDAFTQLTSALLQPPQTTALLARRGRGKSHLMGEVLRWGAKQGLKIAVTSASRSSAQILINVACHDLAVNEPAATWYAPDNKVLLSSKWDALVIEEAAGLSLPVLKKLCQPHSCVFLCTTTDGYEGSAQGFRNRLLTDEQFCPINIIQMSTPIRWLADDPLETLSDFLCFTNDATPVQLAPSRISFSDLRPCEVKGDTLTEILSLLRNAHYQTSPDDLYRIVDSPNNRLFYITNDETGRIIAAAVVEQEGGIALASLADDIASGKRRVKGHLAAQSLAVLASDPTAVTLTIQRINRIAVCTSLQNRGYGNQLVNYIIYWCQKSEADLVSTSFGDKERLRNFWQACGFTIDKIGAKPDKASGLVSALMSRPLSTAGQKLKATLTALMENQWQNVEDIQIKKLIEFTQGSRHLSHLDNSIDWLLNKIPKNAENDAVLRWLLREKPDLNDIAQAYTLNGKKDALQFLRDSVKSALASLKVL